jgi:hypothetical protein
VILQERCDPEAVGVEDWHVQRHVDHFKDSSRTPEGDTKRLSCPLLRVVLAQCLLDVLPAASFGHGYLLGVATGRDRGRS